MPAGLILRRVAFSLFAGLALMNPLLAQETPVATHVDDTDAAPAESEENISLSNPVGVQDNMVDRLVIWRGEEAFSSGETQRAAVEDGRIVLVDPRNSYPRRGSWTSPEIEADFPFTEILPSWSVDAPDETGLTFEVRTHDAETSTWSPWLYMGQWGRTLHWPDRRVSFEGGEVHVDILKLKKPQDRFQLRASLVSYDLESKAVPAIRQLSAVYTARVDDGDLRAKLRRPAVVDGDWARSLPVPFFTQRDNPPEISGSTCSPTSTNMVLAYRGISESFTQTALGIYDPEYGIFGTWNRAVAYASSKGLRGYLTRVRSWDEVKAYIAKGQPLIASIKFEPGTFPSNPMRSTGGHLIVVRGMTPEGDAIVNDPAHSKVGNGIVYKADELARAWFARGGVAYIIEAN